MSTVAEEVTAAVWPTVDKDVEDDKETFIARQRPAVRFGLRHWWEQFKELLHWAALKIVGGVFDHIGTWTIEEIAMKLVRHHEANGTSHKLHPSVKMMAYTGHPE